MVVPIELNAHTSQPPLSPEQTQFLRSLWEGVNYGIFMLDVLEGGTEFRYAAFNPVMARTSKIPVEELLGKTITEALPAEMAALYRHHYSQCVHSGQPISFEERFDHEGQTTWWLLTITPGRNQEDQIDHLTVTAIDISEQKAVQAELQEREQTYRQILDAIGDYVLIKGPQSRILFANKAFRDYYGMSEEELRDIIDAPFNEPDYTQQYVKDDAFVFNSGQILHIPEEPVTRHDGVVQIWNTIKSPVFNLAGDVIMTVGVSRDITERKKTEAALIESEAKFRRFVENANDLIYEISSEGCFTYLSPQFTTMYGGYEVEAFLNQSFAPLVHPEDLPMLLATTQRLFETGERQLGIEFRTRRQDGTWMWLLCNNSPITDEKGTVIGFQGIARDISLHKALEQQLALQQTRFDAFFSAANAGLVIFDDQLRYVHINEALAEMNGVPASAHIGWHLFEVIPHLAESLEPMFRGILETGQPVLDYELVGETPKCPGIIRYWLASYYPLLNSDGKAFGIGGVVIEISDRKAAEAELQQTKNFLESILHNLPVGVFAKEADELRFVLWNPCAEKMLGLTAQEVMGKNDYDFFPQEQADFFTEKDREVLNSSELLDIPEEEILTGTGETRLLHTQKTAIFDKEGRPKYLLGITEDITERKAAEVTLQDYADSQTLLNHLANQIRNSLDLDTVIETTIHAIRNLLEIDQCCFAWYHPEVAPPTWELIKQAQLEALPSSLGCFSAHQVGPIDQLFLSQDVLCINDVEAYEEPVHRAFLQQFHCQSELLLPIQTHSQRRGVIICGNYFQHRLWSEREVELLRAVGDQLAIAIDQAELYAQTQSKSRQLEKALQELQRTQAQVVQSEKMSSLGQLVAGIAHEINNPVNFIHGNLTHAEEYTQNLFELIELYQEEYPHPTQTIFDKLEEIELEFISEDLPKLLTSMKVGTERIREIVKSLRLFSRLDEAEVKPVDIHEGIDSTLMILHNRIKAKADRPEIQIIKNYGNLPPVECYAGQLNQVFMNILVNSIDALDEVNAKRSYEEINHDPSQITISTSVLDSEWVQIVIADNGAGVPEAIKQRIFDPFFTTKPVGKGTGMGMSISYQIITEKHNGKLQCFSMLGEGTQFVIQIPIHQSVSEGI
jgi:PAS domain S-box-containing protein